MLLSTSSCQESVMRFAETVIPNPIVIKVQRDEEIQASKKQYHVTCSNEEDIHEMLTQSSIVFPEVNLKKVAGCLITSWYTVPIFRTKTWQLHKLLFKYLFLLNNKRYKQNIHQSITKLQTNVYKGVFPLKIVGLILHPNVRSTPH